MDPSPQLQAVDLLSAGRLRHKAMAALPVHLRPADPDAAYALQARLHERYAQAGLGRVAGYKIGCTTAVMQAYLKIDHPCAGGVLDATVQRGDGEFAHAGFCRVGVECELAVRLARDLPPEATGHTLDSVADAVGEIMAAIEVVDDRWQDFTGIDAPSLIADDFFGAGCVLGEPVPFPPAQHLARVAGSMTVNDREVGRGVGADILGHPLAALAWLANSGAATDGGLRAGEFVLLGSLVKTRWLQAGDRVEVAVDGIGRAGARFL